jgi:hypothetical protein
MGHWIYGPRDGIRRVTSQTLTLACFICCVNAMPAVFSAGYYA